MSILFFTYIVVYRFGKGISLGIIILIGIAPSLLIFEPLAPVHLGVTTH